MELTGKIIAVMPMHAGTSSNGKEYASQDYVLEYAQGEYPKRMVFNVFGKDKIEQFKLKVGDEVTIAYEPTAREHQGKWYGQNRAWRCTPTQQAQKNDQQPPQMALSEVPLPSANELPQEPDGLPF